MLDRRLPIAVLVLTLTGCTTGQDDSTAPPSDPPKTPVPAPDTDDQGETTTGDPQKRPSDPPPVDGANRPPEHAGDFAGVRQFRFVYGATINGLEAGAKAKIWIPLAQTTHDQIVRREKIDLPGEYRLTSESKHGNALLYFESTASPSGEIPLEIHYLVQRSEINLLSGEEVQPEVETRYLGSSQMMPVDGTVLAQVMPSKEKPAGSDALRVALELYDAVDSLMKYDKPVGGKWGRGDALWACGSGFGNCSDFHSVFIAACRDLKIPAKFEIGFPIARGDKGEVVGYHCWAKFSDSRRWVAVDISEADKHPGMKSYYFGSLTPDRVAFTTGRDLQLEPPTANGPVNFLIYPYVEVAGKPHTQFAKRFRFEEVDSIEGVD